MTVLCELFVSPAQFYLTLQQSRACICQDLVLDVSSDHFLVLTLDLLIETVVWLIWAEMGATYSVALLMFGLDAFAVSNSLLSQLYAVRLVVPDLLLPFAFFSFVHPALHLVVLIPLKLALTVLVLDLFFVALHAVAQNVLIHAKCQKWLHRLAHLGCGNT